MTQGDTLYIVTTTYGDATEACFAVATREVGQQIIDAHPEKDYYLEELDVISDLSQWEEWQQKVRRWQEQQRRSIELPNGQVLHNVHPPAQCEGRACCIHNPGDHHMRGWPMLWRTDRAIMERTCVHGIGHPDPDHMAHTLTLPGPVDEYDSGVHGCDGCCLSAVQAG